MPPKTCMQIMRFNLALQALKKNPAQSLTALSYQFDYYDQAHFINEFKTFTGFSPSAYLKSRFLLGEQLGWKEEVEEEKVFLQLKK